MTSLQTFSDTQVRPGGTRNVLYEGWITGPVPAPAAVPTDIDEEVEQGSQQEEDGTWEVYADAAFMALHRQPRTEEARSLCSDVTDRILEWEQRSQARRRNERRGRLSTFRSAVGSVVGDLTAITEARPRRWLYRPLAREEFTDEPVGYRDFHAVLDAMQALNLIEVAH